MRNTKKVCVYAMGVALYVVLALCIQFPVFENYYLCLGYVAMMIYCYFFGPCAGMIVGGMGVVIYCLLINGLRGMPGWAIGNLVIGLVVGLTCKCTKKMKHKWLRKTYIVISIIVSTAVAMLVVKSGVECLLYAQPMFIRVAKNIYAFIADAVILIVSLPICVALEPVIKKIFPELRKDFIAVN